MQGDLSHLSDSDLENLISQYYSGENIKGLLKHYSIKVNNSKLYLLFPPEVVNENCPYCKTNFKRKRKSRSTPDFMPQENEFCTVCGHINYENCICSNCLDEKAKETNEVMVKVKRVLKPYFSPKDSDHIEFTSLPFKSKLYLAAFLRVGLAEDMNNIRPAKEWADKLHPTDFTEVLVYLITNNLIFISEETPAEAFAIEGDNVGIRFNQLVTKVNPAILLNKQLIKKSELDIIYNFELDSVNESNSNELLTVWKLIALEECIEYLVCIGGRHKFEIRIGDKTRQVLSDLLSHFSTGQVFGIIHSSVTKAAAYFQEGQVSRRQAANSIITRCQQYGEKALASDWDLKGYHRDYDCKQSHISQLLYNRLLKIGDYGFSVVPSIGALTRSKEKVAETLEDSLVSESIKRN